MKSRPAWRVAFRGIATPSVKEALELVAWSLLALLALAMVMIPGDQTAAAIDWLFKRIEAGS